MNGTGLRGEAFVILANAEWDWSNRVNCHHIAARLAGENQVLFVDTIGGRTPAPREISKVLRRLWRIAGGVRHINNHLTVLAPFVFPVYGSDRIRRLNSHLLAWQIRRALPKASAPPVLWIFLPSLVGLVGQFKEKLVIYHCIDEHRANPNVPAEQVRQWEMQLLAQADLVLASSSTLYEAKRKFNANTVYVPNVADTQLFAQARDAAVRIPEELKGLHHPIAGFIGNITAYKLDLSLLCSVAQQRPDWQFVLIGPIGRGDPSTDISKLRRQSNIHLLGERPFAELPGYLKGLDVCLIPFNLNDSTHGTLPLKFFEYLSAGKPVISTDLPALAEFRDFFYPVHNVAEFSDALDAALDEPSSLALARLEIARKYSWDARMVELGQVVRSAMARKSAAA